MSDLKPCDVQDSIVRLEMLFECLPMQPKGILDVRQMAIILNILRNHDPDTITIPRDVLEGMKFSQINVCRGMLSDDKEVYSVYAAKKAHNALIDKLLKGEW